MSIATPECFETIAWVYAQPELAVLLSLLEHEDIWVIAIAGGHASVDWVVTTALGGIEIRVHAADAPRARAVLAGIDRRSITTRFFARNRLVDLLLVLILFTLGCLAPPARLPAAFVLNRREQGD